MGKKKWFWMIACLFIAALSIWAVVSQTQSFNWTTFQADIIASNKIWLTLAILCMSGFIIFEGLAVRSILKAVAPGWKKERNCVVYSAADVYFSAITPSASGGQPVMAFFMKRDGISMAVITSSLLLNLILYTIVLLVIGTTGFLFMPGFISEYGALSQTLITIGFIILVVLIIIFWLLLFKDDLLDKIIDGVFRFLNKIVKFKNYEQKVDKLKRMTMEYQDCADIMAGRKKMILSALGWNFLQRMSQLMVSVCLFLATGGPIRKAFNVWLVQVYSAVGSNSLPIPGGMGAADYLLIDGFSLIPEIKSAANLALMSRGISFYSCVILSLIIVIAGYIIGGRKSDRDL